MFGKRQHSTFSALTLALISAVVLISNLPAHGQTETVLHSFTGIPDGASPQSGLLFSGGNLYGTTYEGGADVGPGFGTVYELSPNGSGGWNETVIYRFGSEPDGADGAYPHTGLIADSAGNLYGTAEYGGAVDCVDGDGCGVAYELSPGPGGWTFTLLYTFVGNGSGSFPDTALAMDSNGNLYGGTEVGGPKGQGITYELSPSAGGWTEQVISNLGAGYLTVSPGGVLFGVSSQQVFELAPDGKGGWNQTFVYALPGPSSALVFDVAGNIYGSAYSNATDLHEVVYKLTPGKRHWTKKTLFTFGNREKDGAGPGVLVVDAAGNLYGTTQFGGLYGEEHKGGGYGTVFELMPPVAGGKYTEKILWNLNGPDGEQPFAGVTLDGAGNLYGTTNNGGASGVGVVYEVTP